MKLFGHPLHLMLIHFPSALFPMDLVCSFIAFYYPNPSFTSASFYAMIGGTFLACLAVITGTFDLIGVTQHKPEAVKKALVHGGINTCVLIGYSVLCYIAFQKYPDLAPDGMSNLLIKSFLVLFMFAGNYLGGSLILKDKVGVEK
jgi:uncharacterized membrane protein